MATYMHSNYIKYTPWFIYIHSNYIKYTPWLYTCTQTTSSIRLGYIHALKLHKVYALVIYMHSNYIKYTPSLYTYTQTT